MANDYDYDTPMASLLKQRQEAELRQAQQQLHDIRTQPYYHGLITRVEAERRVNNAGEFLVRDSISSPSDYVLTAYWCGRPMHFQIQRHESSSNTKQYYSFEEERFQRLPDLIRFYQTHRRCVTEQSQCLLLVPITPPNFICDEPTSSEIEANYASITNRHYNYKSYAAAPCTSRPLPRPPDGSLQRSIIRRQMQRNMTPKLRQFGSESHLTQSFLPLAHSGVTVDAREPDTGTKTEASRSAVDFEALFAGITKDKASQDDYDVRKELKMFETRHFQYCDIDYAAMDGLPTNESSPANEYKESTLRFARTSAPRPAEIANRSIDRDSACCMDDVSNKSGECSISPTKSPGEDIDERRENLLSLLDRSTSAQLATCITHSQLNVITPHMHKLLLSNAAHLRQEIIESHELLSRLVQFSIDTSTDSAAMFEKWLHTMENLHGLGNYAAFASVHDVLQDNRLLSIARRAYSNSAKCAALSIRVKSLRRDLDNCNNSAILPNIMPLLQMMQDCDINDRSLYAQHLTQYATWLQKSSSCPLPNCDADIAAQFSPDFLRSIL